MPDVPVRHTVESNLSLAHPRGQRSDRRGAAWRQHAGGDRIRQRPCQLVESLSSVAACRNAAGNAGETGAGSARHLHARQAEGASYFVFGYRYYIGRDRDAALFLSVELTGAGSQLPISQIPGCRFILTDAKQDACLFGTDDRELQGVSAGFRRRLPPQTAGWPARVTGWCSARSCRRSGVRFCVS